MGLCLSISTGSDQNHGNRQKKKTAVVAEVVAVTPGKVTVLTSKYHCQSVFTFVFGKEQ